MNVSAVGLFVDFSGEVGPDQKLVGKRDSVKSVYRIFFLLIGFARMQSRSAG
ncbi:hypothetical protein ACPOL_5321 [Acidisarcina polymorpha]|uniref:Uncharacterized protein n=1 Tax=Acidisarcina polymorpha TaxID=2211140 RepID=A0A2Z5G648_9BACT|nr:hypothetical protein ACPOL_5321 [Acidisarcina polymorpha]